MSSDTTDSHRSSKHAKYQFKFVMVGYMSKRLFLCLTLSMLLGGHVLAQTAPETVIDVRNGDQKGKLFVRETELAFESLTDAKHSQTWKYADIRTLEKRIWKAMRVRPFKGDRYDFQFDNAGNRDRIYNLISQKVVDARRAKTK